jgi:hypothetical protein
MQVGRARAPFDLGVRRDDIHGRLSDQNPNYCELTGFDEVARSSSADYIGFMHYRRVFTAPKRHSMLDLFVYRIRCLNRRLRRRKNPQTISKAPEIPDLSTLACEAKKLGEFLNAATVHYDIFTPFPVQFDKLSQREEYARGHFSTHFDLFMTTLARLHPEIAAFIDADKKPHNFYYANMFVMRRDLFDQYWHILSTTLFEIAPKISLADLTPYQARIFGFLAERFMAVFIDYATRTQNARHKELHVVICDFGA